MVIKIKNLKGGGGKGGKFLGSSQPSGVVIKSGTVPKQFTHGNAAKLGINYSKVKTIVSATEKHNVLTEKQTRKKAKYFANPLVNGKGNLIISESKAKNRKTKLNALEANKETLQTALAVAVAKTPQDTAEIKKLEADLKKQTDKITKKQKKYEAENTKQKKKHEKRKAKLSKLAEDIKKQSNIIDKKRGELYDKTLSQEDIDAKRKELEDLNNPFKHLNEVEITKVTELRSQLKSDAERKQAIENSIEGKKQNMSTKLTRRKLEDDVKKTKKKMKKIRRKMEIRRKTRKREAKRKRKQEQYNKSRKKGGILRSLGLRGLWERFSKSRYKLYRTNTSKKTNEQLNTTQRNLYGKLLRLGEINNNGSIGPSVPSGKGGPAPSGPGPGPGPAPAPGRPTPVPNPIEDVYAILPPVKSTLTQRNINNGYIEIKINNKNQIPALNTGYLEILP